MNYKDLLEQSYIEDTQGVHDKKSRLEYLSINIFDFTTYDREMDVLFAKKALEVCAAINDGKTFEYIKNPDDYLWYIMLCNTTFFAPRLDWGVSIRGAWWDYSITLNSCGLWQEGKQTTEMKFSQEEWKKFIAAMIEFAAEE